MFTQRFTLTLGSVLLALAATTLTAQLSNADTASAGYRLSTQANPAFGAVECTLANGDLVTFDGVSVDRWKANGSFSSHLGSIPNFGFASFILPTPDGLAVIFGESSSAGIWRAALDGSGLALVTSIPLNYAAAFDVNGDLIVSAVPNGSGNGDYLLRIHFSPFSSTLLGNVVGASGPVAFAPNGDLYYATQDPNFPAAPGSTDVLQWSAAQVALGGLSNANATKFATAFDGGSAMAFDPATGKLYMSEINYGLNEYRIVRVTTDKAHSAVIVDGQNPILSLELLNQGGGAASFDAYQPSTGSNLRYVVTDFASLSDLVTVRPQRPTLVATGAGTTGIGPVTLTLTDGVPNGSMFLFFCPQSQTSPNESKYKLNGFFFFTGMQPSAIRRTQFLLPTDSNGTGSFTFWNPGNLQGQYAFQSFVATPTGSFLGASTTTSF